MPFEKGKSGNPGGRPKETAAVRDAARKYGLKAIKKLYQLMSCGNPRTEVAAAQALLDRGYGKPAQQVILNGDEEGGPLKVQTIEIKAVDP